MRRAGSAGRRVLRPRKAIRRSVCLRPPSCLLVGYSRQVKFKYGERVDPPCAQHQDCARRNTSEALVPPKPNELDSTTSILRWRAVCGTRSIGVSTEGSSRLMVGGAIWSRIPSIEKIASTAPVAPKRCPMHDLVEDIEILAAALPTTRSTAPSSIVSAIVEVPWALM